MKSLTYCCISLCICLFLSCSNKEVENPAKITGTWELRSYYNGWTGKTTLVTDSIRQIKFTSTSYQKFTDGTLTDSGIYRINKEKSVITGKTENRIIYDNNADDFRTFIQLSHDSLTFFVDAYDAGGSLYLKR